jgi:hypothetical protein
MLLSGLCRQAPDVIRNVPHCTLCTSGPVGVQASADTIMVRNDRIVHLRSSWACCNWSLLSGCGAEPKGRRQPETPQASS